MERVGLTAIDDATIIGVAQVNVEYAPAAVKVDVCPIHILADGEEVKVMEGVATTEIVIAAVPEQAPLVPIIEYVALLVGVTTILFVNGPVLQV